MLTSFNRLIAYDTTPLAELGLDQVTIDRLSPLLSAWTSQTIWEQVVLKYLTAEDLDRLEMLAQAQSTSGSERAIWDLVSQRSGRDACTLITEAGDGAIKRFSSCIADTLTDLKKLKQKL